MMNINGENEIYWSERTYDENGAKTEKNGPIQQAHYISMTGFRNFPIDDGWI